MILLYFPLGQYFVSERLSKNKMQWKLLTSLLILFQYYLSTFVIIFSSPYKAGNLWELRLQRSSLNANFYNMWNWISAIYDIEQYFFRDQFQGCSFSITKVNHVEEHTENQMSDLIKSSLVQRDPFARWLEERGLLNKT